VINLSGFFGYELHIAVILKFYCNDTDIIYINIIRIKNIELKNKERGE
jgi:hypothetical protein